MIDIAHEFQANSIGEQMLSIIIFVYCKYSTIECSRISIHVWSFYVRHQPGLKLSSKLTVSSRSVPLSGSVKDEWCPREKE
jgi:hypothetical protein